MVVLQVSRRNIAFVEWVAMDVSLVQEDLAVLLGALESVDSWAMANEKMKTNRECFWAGLVTESVWYKFLQGADWFELLTVCCSHQQVKCSHLALLNTVSWAMDIQPENSYQMFCALSTSRDCLMFDAPAFLLGSYTVPLLR
jgi:hypothetical protein